MAKTIVGLFDTRSEAESVVSELVDSGFARQDIGLIANNSTGAYGDYATPDTAAAENSDGHTTFGAAKGAETGAVVGGLAGLLVGLGAFAIPGLGPVVAAGWIATTLAGAGIGAVAGGLIGALTHIGVPQEHAEYYTEGVRRGGTLVTVKADDAQADAAVDIFHRHGAVDIDERGTEYRQSGFTGFTPETQPYTNTAAANTANTVTANPSAVDMSGTDQVAIPIVEEELQVGKRQVQRGGARVYTHITEQPVEESVTLREEHVTIDRRPVDRPVTDADRAAFQEGTIEMTETREVPVVAKEARVVEEVVVGKNATERTETVRDTVRRTDVDVEELDRDDTLDEDTALTNERSEVRGTNQ